MRRAGLEYFQRKGLALRKPQWLERPGASRNKSGETRSAPGDGRPKPSPTDPARSAFAKSGHLNRKLFAEMLGRIWALPVPGA